MTDVVLAVDVGGTSISAGMVTATGEVLWSVEATTVHTDRGREPGLQQLAGLVRQLRQEAAASSRTVRAVTLGFPEYVSRDCLTSREVIAWDRQPAEVLDDDLDDVPLFVESDVRCAALAEARVAAADEHVLFYVSWGSGISSALVINGVCRAGRRGEAIALGEFDVPAATDPTWTANLEQFASGVGIARRYAAVHPGAAPDARAVAERANAGDVDATAIVCSAARGRLSPYVRASPSSTLTWSCSAAGSAPPTEWSPSRVAPNFMIYSPAPILPRSFPPGWVLGPDWSVRIVVGAQPVEAMAHQASSSSPTASAPRQRVPPARTRPSRRVRVRRRRGCHEPWRCGPDDGQ